MFVCYGFSQNKEAEFTQALKTSTEKEKIYAYTDSLRVYYRKNGTESQYELFSKKVMQLAEALKDYDNYIEIALNLESHYQQKTGDRNISDVYISKAEKYLDFAKDTYLIGTTNSRRAAAFYAKGLHDSALVYYSKAIDVYTDKDSIFKADAIFFRGQSYAGIHDHFKAFEDYKLAKEYYRNLGETAYVTYVSNSEIIIYSTIGLHEKAISKRLELIETLKGTDFNFKSQYYNLSLDYKKNGNPKEQLKYLLKTLDYFGTDDFFKYLDSNIYAGLVSLYLDLNDQTNATKYIKLLNALDFNNLMTIRQIDALWTQAKYHLHFGNSSKALAILNEGFEKAKNLGSVESINTLNDLAHEIHAKLGNHQKSLDFYKKYATVQDSLNSEKKTNTLIYYQTLYEVEQQQQKFDIEKRAQETIIEAQQKSKNNQLLSFLFILALLIGVIVYVYNSRKKLKTQKLAIENALDEKKLLLKEIHHRVKNNLQIVTSLLNIQADGIDDQKVLKAIKEGQNRVQIMGLLHKNLYQSEQVSNIDIKKYVSELLQYLKAAFIGSSDKIEVHLDMEFIHFDFDTAIPLGLIINELVSNAFNHGFTNDMSGNIWVKIEAQNQIDYTLTVTNDGLKLANDFNLNTTHSMGINLIQSLARQLRGTLQLINVDKKTNFVVVFKDLKYHKLSIVKAS